MENTIAIVCIVVALLIRYWVGRRRFNRRGVGGLQHFSSYEKAMVTTFFEKLLMLVSLALLLVAAVLLLSNNIR